MSWALVPFHIVGMMLPEILGLYCLNSSLSVNSLLCYFVLKIRPCSQISHDVFPKHVQLDTLSLAPFSRRNPRHPLHLLHLLVLVEDRVGSDV